MRPLRAGRLRKRVVIEYLHETVGADGQPVEAWQTFAERWASIEPIDTSGRQYLQGAAIESDVTHVVALRFLPGVTAKNRIYYQGRVLEIESVADVDDRGRMLVLMCREQTGR